MNDQINTETRFRIDTPELVALEYPLAGIGSRFIAILIDYLIQGAAVMCLIFGAMLFLPSLLKFQAASAKWFIAMIILVPFLLQWGYFSLFEAFWNGQTPGKRLGKIRVIQQSGRAITLFESLARNLVRIIDFLPVYYAVGVITIFVTSHNQRLGDLVAGTLVVHEGQMRTLSTLGNTRLFTETAQQAPVAPRISTIPVDALSRLTSADLQAVEAFLERRLDMALDVRKSLATRLVTLAAARMNMTPPPNMHPETFLEEVAYGLRSLGKFR